MLLGRRHNPVPSWLGSGSVWTHYPWLWRPGADSRYIGGTTAGVAELADAQDLGSCGRKAVGVQIPPSAPTIRFEGSPSNVLFQALIALDSRLRPGHNTWLERESPGEASPLPGQRA